MTPEVQGSVYFPLTVLPLPSASPQRNLCGAVKANESRGHHLKALFLLLLLLLT